MNTYKDTTALITGASSGIGEEFAKLLAKVGANLILTARSTDKLEALQKSLSDAHSVKVDVISEDLSQPGAATKLHQEIVTRGLHVDLLINNAGFGKWGMFLDFDTDCYNEMLNLNINSLIELSHLCLPAMLEKGDGGIINVASTGAFVPLPYSAVYAATKACVLSFSEGLYGECQGKGVHVMALCPGGTETAFASVANDSVDLSGAKWDSAESVAQDGLDQFLNGRSCYICGKNGNAAFLPRILSRERVIKTTKKMWGGMLKDRGMKID
ncbi:MAG: SDR family oxidoreductase [Candidatus Hydrogenedentota bacterium]